MKNKKDLQASVLIAVASIFLLIIGITFMSLAEHYMTRRGFVMQARNFLSTNEEFLQEYGEIISFKSNNISAKKCDVNEQADYYMDFKCKTTEKDLTLRVFYIRDNGKLKFDYSILKEK